MNKTIDTAETPEWSTDKVKENIEDIIEKCKKHDLEAAQVQRFITEGAKFIDKQRKATLVRNRGDSQSSRTSRSTRNSRFDEIDSDDKASQTSGGTYYQSDVETGNEGREYVTCNLPRAQRSRAQATGNDSDNGLREGQVSGEP